MRRHSLWLVALTFVVAGCATATFPAYVPPTGPAPTGPAVRRALAQFPARWDRQFFASWRIAGRQWPMVGRLNGELTKRLRITCVSELGTLIFNAQVSPGNVRVDHLAPGLVSGPPRELSRQLRLALNAPLVAAANTPALFRGDHESRLHCRDAAGNHYTFIFAGTGGRLRQCLVQFATGGQADFRYRHYDDSPLPGELQLWDENQKSLLVLDFTR